MCFFDKLSEEVTVINENVFERLHHAMKLHATMKYAQGNQMFFFYKRALPFKKKQRKTIFQI